MNVLHVFTGKNNDAMYVVIPTAQQKKQARQDAKEMGVLRDSVTKGRGNAVGAMGEILVAELLKAERVGMTCFSHDIVLSNGITIDVKTTKSSKPVLPHYVARIYGSEEAKEKLCLKCDVYYFVRCSESMNYATILGWLPAREFVEKAMFLPKGHISPDDGRLTYSDEYILPISELNPPSVKISRRRIGKRKA